MDVLIYIGLVMTAVGLGGLVHCILRAARLKRAGADAPGFQSAMHGLVAINLGSVAMSFLGLGLVVAGMLL